MALDSINQGGNLMHVAFNSGFESNSGFREAFSQLFGQPPGRARGSRHISATLVTTPIGPFIAAATPEAVCMLEFGDRPALETQAKTLTRWFDLPIVPGTNDPLERLREELDEYFEGWRTQFTVPLAIAGTEFQQAVWERLLAIPFGETTTYQAVAQDIGRPGAQRAVGKANGDNRLAVLIPCHRVINSQGKLHGYGGGLWRKQAVSARARAWRAAETGVERLRRLRTRPGRSRQGRPDSARGSRLGGYPGHAPPSGRPG
jgi:AraC family transcriptional regulator of adaptative response/methylated-DNA-[protein]-cysteine methyltransferase